MLPKHTKRVNLQVLAFIAFILIFIVFNSSSGGGGKASVPVNNPVPRPDVSLKHLGEEEPASPCECPSCTECPKCDKAAHTVPVSTDCEIFPFYGKVKFKKVDSDKARKHLEKRKSYSDEDWEKEAIRLMDRNKILGYNIIAAANSGHLNFTLNWIASLQHQKYQKFLIFCLDELLYAHLVELGFTNNIVMAPLSWAVRKISPGEHKWMAKEYNHLTEAKTRIQLTLLQKGYWIIFSDVDIVFLSPGVVRHLSFIIGEYCHPVNMPTQCFTEFLYMNDQDTDVNTGFFAARPTETIIDVFQQTIEEMHKWQIDQLAFNWVIRTKLKIKYSKPFKMLDRFLYANGNILNRGVNNRAVGIRPMVAHANYAEGFENKKRIFVKFNMWYLDD